MLKDASATAIYGSRGANGVILITTKKGKGNKINVNFTTNNSLSTIVKYTDVLSPEEYRDVINQYGTQNQIDNLEIHPPIGKIKYTETHISMKIMFLFLVV